MPQTPFPADVRTMLLAPNPAVVATLRADGAPSTVATWYLLEDDDRVLVNMDATRVRLGHLRRDPRLALTVLAGEDWYSHVSLVGRVVDLADDVDLTQIDRLATHYTGSPYRNRESPRVSAWFSVDRWHGWGAHG